MKNMKIKKGTKLIAIDECIMEFENVPSLIIGNTYEITGVFSNYFTISSHQHKEHEFNICELNSYFKIIK
jgi:hypothetical protein